MPRNLGYFHVYENCYFSTYGLETAKRYGEQFYCSNGKRRHARNCKEVQPGEICPDWYRCKRLNEAMESKEDGKLIKRHRENG
jgi:hypothetical protein